jgi:hypothetical protein
MKQLDQSATNTVFDAVTQMQEHEAEGDHDAARETARELLIDLEMAIHMLARLTPRSKALLDEAQRRTQWPSIHSVYQNKHDFDGVQAQVQKLPIGDNVSLKKENITQEKGKTRRRRFWEDTSYRREIVKTIEYLRVKNDLPELSRGNFHEWQNAILVHMISAAKEDALILNGLSVEERLAEHGTLYGEGEIREMYWYDLLNCHPEGTDSAEARLNGFISKHLTDQLS